MITKTTNKQIEFADLWVYCLKKKVKNIYINDIIYKYLFLLQ